MRQKRTAPQYRAMQLHGRGPVSQRASRTQRCVWSNHRTSGWTSTPNTRQPHRCFPVVALAELPPGTQLSFDF